MAPRSVHRIFKTLTVVQQLVVQLVVHADVVGFLTDLSSTHALADIRLLFVLLEIYLVISCCVSVMDRDRIQKKVWAGKVSIYPSELPQLPHGLAVADCLLDLALSCPKCTYLHDYKHTHAHTSICVYH